tara:strand:- start:60 stop:320 length:261 start_codon:yes stop_codon:yes gene_type:complete
MGCVIFHILYETKEIFVKKILEPIKITNPSRKNFANNKNKEISDSAKIEYRIDELAKNAESKKQKNKGLYLKVNLELEDQRILWFR